MADRTTEQAKALENKKIPYKSLVPLPEIIADVFECGVSTKRFRAEYNNLIDNIGSEFHILLNSTLEEIEKASSKQIAKAVERVRKGKINVKPGYDGEFGVVKVFGEGEGRGESRQGFMEFD